MTKKFDINIVGPLVLDTGVPFGVNVSGCARCGHDHVDLRFIPFTNGPHRDDDNSIAWTHWAICPEIFEPVLLRFIKDDDES